MWKYTSSADTSKQARTKSKGKSFQKWRANHLLRDEQYWVMSPGKSTNKAAPSHESKTRFNAWESQHLIGFTIKTLLILCFFLGYIVTFFRRFYEIEDLRISTVSVFMIYLQVPVLNILTWKRFTILSFHVLLIRVK